MQYRHIIGVLVLVVVWFTLLQQAFTRPVNGEQIQIESGLKINYTGIRGLEVGPSIAYATQYTGVVVGLLGALLLVWQTLRKIENKELMPVLLILAGVVLFTQHWAAIVGVVLLMLARMILAKWPVPPATA
jgi:hypothetical protein